ncbi:MULTISPECIES: hypothetical protein [Enterococcus]|jgi:hypothetical protein|uniref:hypothetical protein n=1 Tax=Enterococcus TaxID=1350 RepID=UPI001025BDF2|nr:MULTISPECIES: hypothetical protein [Enterococcus]TXX29715.1 hypothetical protein D4M43_23655 [Escherichia coli]DAL85409.1 MAG TPA: hypothetical protein [Caudoviricetes sp.]MCI5684550.1 hypothetical protein [Enterococcus gallinarum]MCR1932861.1 hypothetical protein [Enterococcus gallinarum]MDT2695019.1 hypothetical protein [Enterococcus gallinarum]
MTKQVNFRPEVKKATSKSNGNVEVLLVVNNGSLKGKYDDLSDFLGKTVSVTIQPETIGYQLPINKQTKRPNVNYIVNADGTVEVQKEEQTSLDVGDGVEEVEVVEIQVSKDTIDEFIKKAVSLELPDEITINPRDVLIQLEQGEKINDVAADWEMSETALIDQIEFARQYFAPFADTWSKIKDDVIFQDRNLKADSGDPDEEE